MVAAVIRTAFVQETQAEAIKQWRESADNVGTRFPKVQDLMERAEDDVLEFMSFPQEHWPQIASTNPIERLNREIKRRSRVVGIFPNDASVLRLVGALMGEQTDEWQVRRTRPQAAIRPGPGQGRIDYLWSSGLQAGFPLCRTVLRLRT